MTVADSCIASTSFVLATLDVPPAPELIFIQGTVHTVKLAMHFSSTTNLTLSELALRSNLLSSPTVVLHRNQRTTAEFDVFSVLLVAC